MRSFPELYEKALSVYRGWPVPVQRLIRGTWSFVAGLAAALILSYVLYRVALPSKPFIYVAF